VSKQFEIFSGSMFDHQRRLFTRVNLSAILQQGTDLALRQFARGSRDSHNSSLVECIYERFECAPLRLSDDVKIEKTSELSNGKSEFQFAAKFVGDPILWDCSPTPVEDVLPDDCNFSDWFLPPGETLQRPYGEIYRGHLILVQAGEDPEAGLQVIRDIIALQSLLVDRSNRALQEQLTLLAEISSLCLN